jgi:hypothetical protein
MGYYSSKGGNRSFAVVLSPTTLGQVANMLFARSCFAGGEEEKSGKSRKSALSRFTQKSPFQLNETGLS